jgi:hypothetical protein
MRLKPGDCIGIVAPALFPATGKISKVPGIPNGFAGSLILTPEYLSSYVDSCIVCRIIVDILCQFMLYFF